MNSIFSTQCKEFTIGDKITYYNEYGIDKKSTGEILFIKGPYRSSYTIIDGIYYKFYVLNECGNFDLIHEFIDEKYPTPIIEKIESNEAMKNNFDIYIYFTICNIMKDENYIIKNNNDTNNIHDIITILQKNISVLVNICNMYMQYISEGNEIRNVIENKYIQNIYGMQLVFQQMLLNFTFEYSYEYLDIEYKKEKLMNVLKWFKDNYLSFTESFNIDYWNNVADSIELDKDKESLKN